MLGLEHGDWIFVAEFILLTVSLDVMPVFWGSLDVHHSRIPFAAVSRNRIRSPMNKNSELGVLVPLRRFIVLQELRSLRVILAACLLPDLIDPFWRFR